MKSLRKFREENGLADIKATTDVSGTEGELLNDLASLIRNNADTLRRVLRKSLNSGLSTDEENAIKNFIGIIGHLKDSPKENKDKMRDPMDNVVVRPASGPDGTDPGSGGGGE